MEEVNNINMQHDASAGAEHECTDEHSWFGETSATSLGKFITTSNWSSDVRQGLHPTPNLIAAFVATALTKTMTAEKGFRAWLTFAYPNMIIRTSTTFM